jgi:DNA polymerase
MDNGGNSSLAEQFAAALDWWREAGVDSDFVDSPQGWIAPEVEAEPEMPSLVAAPKPAPAPPAEIDRSNWPTELTAFAPWWLAEAWLDGGQLGGRVAPRGSLGAPVMVLVAEPERDDTTELLSGPQGRLLAAMLAAMGLAPESAYVASVLPRHTPHADWNEAALRGMGDLARHHVALAAPQRLIVFGSNILSLLGHDPANFPAGAGEFAHGGSRLPMLAARDLAVLLERPVWKAGIWQNWLDWTKSA